LRQSFAVAGSVSGHEYAKKAASISRLTLVNSCGTLPKKNTWPRSRQKATAGLQLKPSKRGGDGTFRVQ
jgi:hypothetical protein